MKKTFTLKKLFAAVLTVTMILSGTLTAFGAETTGIQVQYNGNDIALTDAAKIVDGRVMVPFRQLLESMGAEVTYDLKTKTIVVKTDEKEMSFAAGGADITIIKDGVTSVKKMDVASFVDKKQSRTYVPVRFIAETMGYSVGWDKSNKTVVIIDPATLFSNADTDFSIISKLMKSDLDLEKPYATTGKFDMDIETFAGPDSIMPGMEFSMTGQMSGIQQKSNADLVMNMAFQFDKMLSKLTVEEKAMMEPMLGMFKDASMKIKMDGETGITYMNSSLFSALDPTVGANTWYKMNMYDTYEDMGIDLKSITNMSYSGFKLSEMLAASMAGMEYTDISTYQDIQSTYVFLKNLIGDEAFTKRTAGSYVTYNLNLNQTSILAALAKTALSEGISKDTLDLTELGDMLNSSKLEAKIMIQEKAGSLYKYELEGDCTFEEIACNFDMAGDQKNAEGQFMIDQKDVMKMMIEVESHVSETSTAPDLSLPADAVIKEYPIY